MMSNKNKYISIAFFIIFFIIIFLLINHLYLKNRISSNVYFKDINLGGKSYSEAEEILNTLPLTFLGPEGEVISLPLNKMGINLNNTQIIQTGFHLSTFKPWFKDLFTVRKEKVFVPFQYQLDEELLSQNIDFLIEHFSRQPENAYVRVGNDNQVKMVPERFGYQFNHDDIQQAIVENLAQLDSPFIINIPVDKKTPPPITVSTLEDRGIRNLMISFSTKFDPTLTTRVHNIKLAAATINNYFLAPGEAFSYNRIIGNPTSKKGYQAANVIIGGELVPGIGGGLCQISSTLYNAALLANLEILERHSHQLTVPYIDPGRDATVSYPYKNLSFRNNKNHYILITAGVDKDELTIRLYGQPLDERVKIKTNRLETYPSPAIPSNPDNQDKIIGYPGYLVEVWKTVYRGGKIVQEKKISVDKYAPFHMKQGPGH
ncbi:MAG: VanW family protein [Syntrophomonas sp.]